MKKLNEKYENIIIGGGWSGIEAANILAKNGHDVLLMTINLDTIGWIQTLSPVQQSLKELLDENNSLYEELLKDGCTIDKRWDYAREIKFTLDKLYSLCLRQDTAIDIKEQKKGLIITGATGQEYICRRLIVCAGTFIGSSINMPGHKVEMAGRDNEIAVGNLGKGLKNLGIKLVKTEIECPNIIKTQKGMLKSGNNQKNIVSEKYQINYHVLKKGQTGNGLESLNVKNLFFAGRCIGCETSQESAITGIIVGHKIIGQEVKALALTSKLSNVSRGTLRAYLNIEIKH